MALIKLRDYELNLLLVANFLPAVLMKQNKTKTILERQDRQLLYLQNTK